MPARHLARRLTLPSGRPAARGGASRSLQGGPPPAHSRARMIASTVCLASPKSMEVFSLKNSGFCTPA